MKTEVLPIAEQLSERAAEEFAARIREGVAQRGRFVLAVSGGTEPWAAFRRLAAADVPWDAVHIAQVDERVAPAGDPQRNWTHLKANLLDRIPIGHTQLHPMPVEDEPLADAARRYAGVLEAIAGSPPVLDLVHLGLGDDGHTASLLPGDPVLDLTDADVAVTGSYRGFRRMTLTFPIIGRARAILWLVGGEGKAQALQALLAGDAGIPAGRVRQDIASLLTDRRTLGNAG
jgi:6-phosphogluconolactonase